MFWNAQRRPREENVAAFSVERPERAASLPNRRFAARPHTPFLGKPAVPALVQTPFTFDSRRAARRGLATPPRHRAGFGAGASALDSAARAGCGVSPGSPANRESGPRTHRFADGSRRYRERLSPAADSRGAGRARFLRVDSPLRQDLLSYGRAQSAARASPCHGGRSASLHGAPGTGPARGIAGNAPCARRPAHRAEPSALGRGGYRRARPSPDTGCLAFRLWQMDSRDRDERLAVLGREQRSTGTGAHLATAGHFGWRPPRAGAERQPEFDARDRKS